VIVDEKGIKDSWKKYMEKLMNEENELDHRISDGVKEGLADCIRIDKDAGALKKMKRQSLSLQGSLLPTHHAYTQTHTLRVAQWAYLHGLGAVA